MPWGSSKKKAPLKMIVGKVVFACVDSDKIVHIFVKVKGKKQTRIYERMIRGIYSGLAATELLMNKTISFPEKDYTKIILELKNIRILEEFNGE